MWERQIKDITGVVTHKIEIGTSRYARHQSNADADSTTSGSDSSKQINSTVLM